MKKAICFITFLLILVNSQYADSQSLSVYKVDASAFPIIKAKVYAFDAAGNQIKNLSTSDFEVKENGLQRTVIDVSCPNSPPPNPISAVLTIDISGSMGGQGLLLAKEFAKAWVNQLLQDNNECALTSFGSINYINQDFTTDQNKLINAISSLQSQGGTDYDYGLLKPFAGSLEITKPAKNQKIIIFITDGFPSHAPQVNQIIAEANKQNCSIYSVIVGYDCPQILKDISEQTGGNWFENINTVDDAKKMANQILKTARGGNPCTIKWESGIDCKAGITNLVINIKLLNLTTNASYKKLSQSTSKLNISPNSLFLQNVIPGEKKDTIVTITAYNADFDVKNITSTNPAFSISPTNFNLSKGHSTNLTISFFPIDSGYTYTTFDFESNSCPFSYFVVGGFLGKKSKTKTLKLTSPNGGEQFIVGSDTLITWEGISESTKVNLDYSIDNGSNWISIGRYQTGLKYIWKNVPKPESNQCKVRVKQISRSESGYDNDPFHQDLGYNKEALGYNESVHSFCWSPDGKFIATSCADSNAYIWDSFTREKVITLSEHNESVSKISWSPDGNCLVTASLDHTAIIWNAITMEKLFTLNLPEGRCNGISWSPDSKLIAAYFENDITPIIWDAKTGIVLNKLFGHTGPINKLSWCPDGKRLATFSFYDVAIIWDALTGNKIFTLNDYSLDKISCVSWSPDGSRLATAIKRDAIIWDASTGKKLMTLTGHNSYISEIAWSPDGSRILTAGEYDEIIVWDATGGNMLKSMKIPNRPIDNICWSPDGTRFASINNGNYLRIWDATTGVTVFKGDWDTHEIYGISWSPDGMRVATNHYFSVVIWVVNDSFYELESDESDSVFSIVIPSASANDIDMKKCLVGSSKDSVITDFVRNTGSYKFRVDSIYFTGPDAQAFNLIAGKPKYILEPKESKTSEINFTPNRIGIHSATINIITQSDSLRQNIQGEGVEPQLEVISNFLDFGKVEILHENTIQDTALIKNISNIPVTIIDVIQLGPDKTQFEVISGGGSFTLQPNESRKLTLRFKPIFGGRTSGQLGFDYNGTGSPAVVQLFGTGIGGLVYILNDSAYAGEKRNLQLVMANIKPEGLAEIAPNFEAKIRFQNTILVPQDRSNSVMVNDSVYMKISGTIGSNIELAQIPVIAGLGNVEETTIDIVDIILIDNLGIKVDYNFETTSGTFKLLGICREGGTRLFNPTGKVEIMQINPNPASDDIEISFNLIEDGCTTLSVFNSNGIKIKELDLVGETGMRTINLNARDFANGLYFIQLQTPTVITNQKLMILK